MSTYQIFTDGGAIPNPGVGAYAIVVIDPSGRICENHCEGKLNSTNNQMEMEAMLLALQYAHAHQHLRFTITSDSKYVINGLTSWLPRWKRQDWMNAAKQPVKNKQLWQELSALYDVVSNVKVDWVKGHSDHRYNDAVDRLCSAKIIEINRYGLPTQPQLLGVSVPGPDARP